MMCNRMMGERGTLDLKPPIDEALMTFHIELTETCIDLMARYTFSTYSAQPKRLSAADFLLKEGQSMTWLLGNKLITITTSGCSNKAMRNGLCDNCWAACKLGPSSIHTSSLEVRYNISECIIKPNFVFLSECVYISQNYDDFHNGNQ